jgi:hypothetical protein
MLIMLDEKWIERVPPGHVNSLDGPLSLGHQRNKIILCITTLDATNSQGLWLHDEPYPSICDNESAKKIAYNPSEHSRTKHIDIWHHFLRDHVIKGDIVISHVGTNDQVADIFTKPLDEKQFREV